MVAASGATIASSVAGCGVDLCEGCEPLGADHAQEGEAFGVFGAGGGGEDDELLGLVVCGEDQAVEHDHTDGGVSDALVRLGGQADLVLFPQHRELRAALEERVDELSCVRVARIATLDAAQQCRVLARVRFVLFDRIAIALLGSVNQR